MRMTYASHMYHDTFAEASRSGVVGTLPIISSGGYY